MLESQADEKVAREKEQKASIELEVAKKAGEDVAKAAKDLADAKEKKRVDEAAIVTKVKADLEAKD